MSEEIPDDIRVTALELAYAWAEPGEEAADSAIQAIAAALLAERRAQIEAAAQIADEYLDGIIEGHDIANAIRAQLP